MNVRELRKEDINKLKDKLLFLYREKLRLKFEKNSGAEFVKTHLIKYNRKNIAKILTVIFEKENNEKL